MDLNVPMLKGLSPSFQLFENKFKALQNAQNEAIRGGKPLDKKELQKVASEFESFFIYYMLKQMRETIPKSGLLGESLQHETYTSMMDQELAKKIASEGGIGLARMLVEQLINNNDKH